MNTVRLLFLGGAKRVSMARRFKSAAADLGLECEIFSYEKSLCEAIACEATVIAGLLWKDPEIYDDLRKIIADKKINAVIPFVDGAVAVASRLRDVAFVPAGNEDDAEVMFDKVRAAELFQRLGLPIPQTYHYGDACMQLIAKPRHGSASKGIVEISSLQKLEEVLSEADKYLIQRRIDRRTEYTVDCYADVVTGEILALCPRIRLEVSGGEVTRTCTVDDEDVILLARKTIELTGLRGAITIQMIRDLDDNSLMLMEINPRLGGGAVCSVAAGADLPKLILQQSLGLKSTKKSYKVGVEIARYPAEVVFEK